MDLGKYLWREIFKDLDFNSIVVEGDLPESLIEGIKKGIIEFYGSNPIQKIGEDRLKIFCKTYGQRLVLLVDKKRGKIYVYHAPDFIHKKYSLGLLNDW